MPTIKQSLINKEFCFDVKLRAAVRIHAPSESEARRLLCEALDCADANLGWDQLGDRPLTAEVSIHGRPRLFTPE